MTVLLDNIRLCIGSLLLKTIPLPPNEPAKRAISSETALLFSVI